MSCNLQKGVCFLWKCVDVLRANSPVCQKSTQRGSEYEEDMWDLWLFQANLGWWFMLLHLLTLTVPLVFIVFPCFSYNWTCNISRLGKRKTIFKNALVGDMLVPRRLLYTSFKKLWRSYHGCQPSHQAVLYLNRHDCSFVPQQTCWPIEVVHCRYTRLLIHLYMYMYVIDMYLEPKWPLFLERLTFHFIGQIFQSMGPTSIHMYKWLDIYI